MKTQIVYKVVKKTPINYISARCGSLIYEIGTKTIPEFGKIFCFKCLDDARRFSFGYLDELVFEGIGENLSTPRRICGSPCSQDILDFWNKRKNKKKYLKSMKAPKGTVFVDSFTPQRIV